MVDEHLDDCHEQYNSPDYEGLQGMSMVLVSGVASVEPLFCNRIEYSSE